MTKSGQPGSTKNVLKYMMAESFFFHLAHAVPVNVIYEMESSFTK